MAKQRYFSDILPGGYSDSSPFGITPGQGEYKRRGRPHKGRDLAAKGGSIIHAPADGVVVESGFNEGGWGNYVKVRHGDGSTTLYGHMQKRNVKVGDKVGAGQTLGLVGSTGRSSGPHLHLEIRDAKGQLLDPDKFQGWGEVVAAVKGQPQGELTAASASPPVNVPNSVADLNFNTPNLFDEYSVYDPTKPPAPQPIAMATPEAEGIQIAQDVKAPGYEFQNQAVEPSPTVNESLPVQDLPTLESLGITGETYQPQAAGIPQALSKFAQGIDEAERAKIQEITNSLAGSVSEAPQAAPVQVPTIDVEGALQAQKQQIIKTVDDIQHGRNLNDVQNAVNAAIRTGSAGTVKVPYDPSRPSGMIGAVGGGFLPVAAATLLTGGAGTVPTALAIGGTSAALGFGNTLDQQQMAGRAPNYGEAVVQGGLDAATSLIPVAKGASMAKRIAANAALGGLGAGGTNLAVQLARNGQVDLPELGTQTAIGAGIGGATGIPGTGVARRGAAFEPASIEIGPRADQFGPVAGPEPVAAVGPAAGRVLQPEIAPAPLVDMGLSPGEVSAKPYDPSALPGSRATGMTAARMTDLLDKGSSPTAVGTGYDWNAKLPKDLSFAKPRYNYGQKQFEGLNLTDVDKALFIVAQRNPSKRDADFMEFLQGVMPNETEMQIRQLGRDLKDHIKTIAKDAEPGSYLDINPFAQEGYQNRYGQKTLPVDKPLFGKQEAVNILQAMNESKELDMPFADFAERFSVPYQKKGAEITVFVPGAGKVKVSDQISVPGFFAELSKRQGAANPYKSLVSMMTKGEAGQAAFLRELDTFANERLNAVLLQGETPDNAGFIQAMDVLSRKGERDANIQAVKEDNFAEFMMQQRQAYLDDLDNSLTLDDLHKNLTKVFDSEASDFGRNVDEGFWTEAMDIAARREREMTADYSGGGRQPNPLEKAQLDRQLENQLQIIQDEKAVIIPDKPVTELPKRIEQQLMPATPLVGDLDTMIAQGMRGSGFNSLDEAKAYFKTYQEQFQGAAPPRQDLRAMSADIPDAQVPTMASQYRTALETGMVQAPQSYVKRFLERADLAQKGELTKAQMGAIKADFMMLEHYKQQGLYEQTLGSLHPHLKELLKTDVDPATGVAQQLPLNQGNSVPVLPLDQAMAQAASVVDLKRILPAMQLWDESARNGTKAMLSYVADIAGPRGGIQDKGLVTPLGFAVTKKGVIGVGYNRDGHIANYYFNRTAEGSMMTKLAPSDEPGFTGMYPSVYETPGVFDAGAWLARKPQPPSIMNTSQAKLFVKVLENAKRLGATAELTDDVRALIDKTIKQGRAAEVSDLNKIYYALQESPLDNVRAFCNALDLGVK